MINDKFRILVVDDEESLRGIIQEVLTDAGYEVSCAGNGNEALEMVGQQPFDVIISDIRMPGMTGIELLEAVKKEKPELQVIIMTSHASIDTAIQAIRLGAYDYLTKPFEDLDVITTVINRTIEKLKLEREVKYLLDMLSRRNKDIERLYTLTNEISPILQPEELIKKSVDSLAQLCSCENIFYFVYHEPTTTLQARLSAKPPKKKWEELKFELKGIKSIASYHKVINNDVELKKRMAFTEVPANTYLLPLEIDKQFVGCYALVDNSGSAVDKGCRDLANQFVGTVCTQAEKAKLHETIRTMAQRDGLTGLHNHRHFQHFLENEIKRVTRFKKPVSLLLFDIDHFKNYNDKNGHPQGDALLREIGKLLQDGKRSIDLVARYGGEEFVIVLVETDLEGAKIKADRVCELIASHDFAHKEKQPLGCVSVSIGVAEYPGHAGDRQSLIEAADAALYKAKDNGRNQVCIAEKTGS